MEEFIKNNIEEFVRGGKNFIYFNLKPLKSNEQFDAFSKAATDIIKKYPKKSIYLIASRTTFIDSYAKENCVKWLMENEPYIIDSVLVEIDGITLMAARDIYKRAQHELVLFPTKEEAVEYLLQRDAAPTPAEGVSGYR